MRRAAHRVEYLLDAARGRRVLHVGCADDPYTSRRIADGSLLHARLAEVAAELYGIDTSREGIATMRAAGYANLAVAAAEEVTGEHPFGRRTFDVIIAGEVIEHVSNAGAFLDALRLLLPEGGAGKLIITTVNSYCAFRFAYTLLTGHEGVHDDHTAYYSPRTLRRLLERHGYQVCDLQFYAADEWEHVLNRGRMRVLWWIDRLACRLRPTLSDGIIVAASATGDAS
jgi:2-polyprenyl-3-methyl-5-hydroxy-6-metoxy-1,4-benzoquinol methylase